MLLPQGAHLHFHLLDILDTIHSELLSACFLSSYLSFQYRRILSGPPTSGS